MAAQSVFGARARSGSKHIDLTDPEGEFDVREDEEQSVKLNQTVELLLAAGYFRARIKGLSPFDKVVGGMTWCLTTCNYDIDVDLLFQENSTIGQKIALTEKIVAVLPKMKCPHRIEPHQIQGLDFIHIYPVVQWLVKRAIETREEMGDYVRQYSISQFDKYHATPEDEAFLLVKEKAIDTVKGVKDVYRPERKYKRHDAAALTDEETRVHSTLLEYGRRYGLSKSERSEKDGKVASKKAALEAGMSRRQAEEEQDEEARRVEEENRIKALMSGMSAMGAQEGKLTASAVGSLVGLQSQEIQQIASEYADKQSEIDQMSRSERVSGGQQHKRMVAALNKQIQLHKDTFKEVQAKHSELEETYLATQEQLKQVQEYSVRIDKEMSQFEEQETGASQSILEKLRGLVAMNESLKKQEQEFRAHCKDEMARLQGDIKELKAGGGGVDSQDKERMELIEKQLASDREKLHKIRLLLARKNREISTLQRKIDEAPSHAELIQYQRRFDELYNQVAAKHKETKQFFTLYNTLHDTKLYLIKEVNLLNSIHDTFEQAMASPSNKEEFLKQLEQKVEGVKQNRNELNRRSQEEKMKRDQLSDQYLNLVDMQRTYFKTVKDFMQECRKNEILKSKLKS